MEIKPFWWTFESDCWRKVVKVRGENLLEAMKGECDVFILTAVKWTLNANLRLALDWNKDFSSFWSLRTALKVCREKSTEFDFKVSTLCSI